MKTYATWEVIKMLTENPKLKFKQGYVTLYANERNFLSGSFDNTEGINGNVGLDKEWTLVQQPVSFMEAAKAFDEGKNVRCLYPDFSRSEMINEKIFKQDTRKGSMREEDDLTFYMAIHGTWYIEEE